MEVEDDRSFAFRVSDSRDPVGPIEEFEPAIVNGRNLDVSWDEALRRFWRERECVREMRRVEKEVVIPNGRFGKLSWLKWQDCSWKDLYQEDEDDDDECYDEEEFWKSRIGKVDGAGRAGTADESRRDSGGGQDKEIKSRGEQEDDGSKATS